MATNTQRFVSAEIVAYELGRSFKSKTWDIGDIRTWCGEVETRYIKDIETMVNYEEIDLTVDNGMVLLPCNIFRILDVYEHRNRILEYDMTDNGTYIYNFRHNGRKVHYPDGSRIFINYRGTNIDEKTGEMLIVKGHEIPCKTWCKINAFEEDAAMGRFNEKLWFYWKEEFSGQFQAAKQNFQHKSRSRIDNLNIIRGNMIPKIAGLSLHHELYK